MKKAKRISARLSAETAQKLKRLIEETESNMSQVIEKALDVYFLEAVKREGGSWKALGKAGFIGCAKGPSNLSADFKRYLTDGLTKKI